MSFITWVRQHLQPGDTELKYVRFARIQPYKSPVVSALVGKDPKECPSTVAAELDQTRGTFSDPDIDSQCYH